MQLTESELIQADQDRDPRCKFGRIVVGRENQIVGFGHFTQFMYKYHPQKFFLNGAILPDFQYQCLGSELYNHLLTLLRPFKPISLTAHTRADRHPTTRFLIGRGFREICRESDSILNPLKFDPIQYHKLEEKLLSKGIVIKTFCELESDPDRDQKLYDLNWVISSELQGEQETKRDFDTFLKEEVNANYRLPEGNFVAVRGTEYIGICNLMTHDADKSVFHDLTGVKSDYRRMGIGLALKVRAIMFAKDSGYTSVKTGNEVNNRPALKMNERLGFLKMPEWILFEKTLPA